MHQDDDHYCIFLTDEEQDKCLLEKNTQIEEHQNLQNNKFYWVHNVTNTNNLKNLKQKPSTYPKYTTNKNTVRVEGFSLNSSEKRYRSIIEKKIENVADYEKSSTHITKKKMGFIVSSTI